MKIKPVHILLGVGILFVIGLLAIAGGGLARLWLDASAPVLPTTLITTPPVVLNAQTVMPVPSPMLSLTPPGAELPNPQTTSTPRPTSTPLPSPTLTPVPEYETVRLGEGVFAVCRRHCPGISEAQTQECKGEVAQLNGLQGNNPQLSWGQKLLMPPCPRGE